MTISREKVYEAIAQIAEAEKITKSTLGKLSRTILNYVWDTADIDAVNRLLTVVTPVNKRGLILYFNTFLAHEMEKTEKKEFVRFGKMFKSQKRIAKYKTKTDNFLSNRRNNFWTWQKENVEVEKKAINTRAKFETAIKQLRDGVPEKDGRPETPAMTDDEIVKLFIFSGVSVTAILDGAEALTKMQADAAKVMNPETTAETAAILEITA